MLDEEVESAREIPGVAYPRENVGSHGEGSQSNTFPLFLGMEMVMVHSLYISY